MKRSFLFCFKKLAPLLQHRVVNILLIRFFATGKFCSIVKPCSLVYYLLLERRRLDRDAVFIFLYEKNKSEVEASHGLRFSNRGFSTSLKWAHVWGFSCKASVLLISVDKRG